jgi:succinoglycan biosynthesis transport protein ExoP
MPNSLSITPLSFVRMIWKGKWLLLAVWVLFSIPAAVIVYKLQPTYRAEAAVLVDSQKIPEGYVKSTVNTEVQDRVATISQQILSFNRLQKIITDFSLYREERKGLTPEELVDKMRKDITIKLEHGWTGNRPGAFRIAYSGEDPNSVAQVANRLSVLFVDENLRTREVQAVGTEEFITTQLAEAKKTLDELEAKVSQYKQTHSGELPEQQQSLISTLGQLRSILDASRDNLNRAQDAKLMLENNLSMTEITLHALEKTVANEKIQPEVSPSQRQKPQSEILQERYAVMLKRYSATHPDAQALRRAIESAIEEEHSSTPSASTTTSSQTRAEATIAVSNGLQLDQARERVRMLKSQIALSDKELTTRKAEQDKTMKEIASYQDRLGRLPVREQEMAQLLRDYENSKNNYRILLDKKLSAEMATEMERRQKSERFTILDPARPPSKPISPNRPLLYTAGCFLGLMLGASLVLLREVRKSLFLGEWELPAGVIVLGKLPVVEILPRTGSETKRSGLWRRLKGPTVATSA